MIFVECPYCHIIFSYPKNKKEEARIINHNEECRKVNYHNLT